MARKGARVMAVSHISMGSTTHAQVVRDGLRQIVSGLQQLNHGFKALELMKDGNAFGPYAVDKFGFIDAAGAQAAFDELNSLLAKLNTDGNVSNVNAALHQCYRKL